MQTITLKIDYRIISIILLGIILLLITLWRPWENLTGDKETITVTGQGVLNVEPDQFTFTPTYQQTHAEQAVAQRLATEKGNEVVSKVKELGVKDNQIQTSVSVNQDYTNKPISPEGNLPTPTGYQANYTITIKVENEELAQKVLNYLATTSPLYSLTPQPSLSTKAQSKLELEARQLALNNAKEKATQTAEQLDQKLGKAIKISDVQQTGGVIPIFGRETSSTEPAQDSSTVISPTLMQGSQEISFSLSVEYELK